MTDETIYIAIADDHPIVRKGIIGLISVFQQFQVVIEASDGTELIDRINTAEIKPDICILDIIMPRMNGYQTLQEVKRNWNDIKVLIFTECCNEFSIRQMMNSGANGYLGKNCNPRQLHQALAAIYYHDYYLSEYNSKVIGRYHKNVMCPRITDREMEFLCNCCSELSYKEIAAIMHVSPRTVEAFRDALFSKFNLSSRTGLVLFAVQNGIVCLPSGQVEA